MWEAVLLNGILFALIGFAMGMLVAIHADRKLPGVMGSILVGMSGALLGGILAQNIGFFRLGMILPLCASILGAAAFLGISSLIKWP